MSDYTHIINGKAVTSPKFLDVINPATQQIIAQAPIATEQQVDDAVAAARAAFPAWSATPIDERAKILMKIADVIDQNAEEYQKLITLEQGKTLTGSKFENDFGAIWLRETAKFRLPDNVMVDNEKERVVERYIPVGVCSIIVPWNWPLLAVTAKMAPCLLTGNTAIIKPSPFTPLTCLRFIEDIQHLVPPGVVNVLSGDDDLGPWITAHPGIDKISFTGSSFTGQKVMASASVGLKRLTLELGGNDPAIILPDVILQEIVPQIFWGTFQVTGQACVAAKRIYIHEAIYDQFRDALVAYSKTVKVGNGMDPDSQIGPIQNLPQYKKVLSYFQDAHANGYKFALGGDVDPNPTGGLYVPISIVDNPPEDSRLVREEQFGPIVPLLKWSDEQDVVRRANDTALGLAASVWGKDIETVERIGMQIQAGTVSMNQFIPFHVTSSFGGHKQSGLGVEGGLNGLKEYCNLQTIALKKSPTATVGA